MFNIKWKEHQFNFNVTKQYCLAFDTYLESLTLKVRIHFNLELSFILFLHNLDIVRNNSPKLEETKILKTSSIPQSFQVKSAPLKKNSDFL